MADEENGQDTQEEQQEESPAEAEAPAEEEAAAEDEAPAETEEAPDAVNDKQQETETESTEEAPPENAEETPPENAETTQEERPFDEDEGKRKMEEAQQARAARQAEEMEEYEAMRKVEREREEGGRSRMEAQQARAARQAEEMEEYEAMRKVEREKEEEAIRVLKEKKEGRKQKIIEDDARLRELGAQEEQRRKHEDEERRHKKLEAERQKQEEKDRKRKEAEERLKPKKPNYVIQKRQDGDKNPNVSAGPVAFGADDMEKSKEQLEEEKRAVLAQRVQPMSLSGFDKQMLIDKARELHEHLRKVVGETYDLEENMKRQQYDMMELQERARQMNKGGKRNQASVQVNESFDRLADKFAGAPPRIQLCSKYERHTDHRTYTERRELFTKEDQEEEELLAGEGEGTEAAPPPAEAVEAEEEEE